jgi:uncharacterized Zn finger protein
VLIKEKELPWWMEHQEEIDEPTLEEKPTDFASFWQGKPDELKSNPSETNRDYDDASLLERVGAPIFLKESNLFLRVMGEIYEEVRQKTINIAKKRKGV